MSTSGRQSTPTERYQPEEFNSPKTRKGPTKMKQSKQSSGEQRRTVGGRGGGGQGGGGRGGGGRGGRGRGGEGESMGQLKRGGSDEESESDEESLATPRGSGQRGYGGYYESNEDDTTKDNSTIANRQVTSSAKRLKSIQAELKSITETVQQQKQHIKKLNKAIEKSFAENVEMRRLLTAAPSKKGTLVKDDYFFRIQSGIKMILKTKLFPSVKYLPEGWETYSETKNTVCQILIKGVTHRPSNLIIEVYWRDVLVPFVNSTYVQWRGNLNQRIKKVYESKSYR